MLKRNKEMRLFRLLWAPQRNYSRVLGLGAVGMARVMSEGFSEVVTFLLRPEWHARIWRRISQARQSQGSGNGVGCWGCLRARGRARWAGIVNEGPSGKMRWQGLNMDIGPDGQEWLVHSTQQTQCLEPTVLWGLMKMFQFLWKETNTIIIMNI